MVQASFPTEWKDRLFAKLPPENAQNLLPQISRQVRESGKKVVVLDDDPTGTQTVSNVYVLTVWTVDSLVEALRNQHTTFYILTNSRSLSTEEAIRLNRQIGANLLRAKALTNQDFVVVSRSDSTLRGHFPAEVDALSASLGLSSPAYLIIPFFEEGGRYTINDVHYVAEGDRLIPAGETPYAQDKVFGYRSSNLRDWVEEKTKERIARKDVFSISIDDIRVGGVERVKQKLLEIPPNGVGIVNAVSYSDMEVFVMGLLKAEAQGKEFIYRTAASFVRVRAGISPRPLLSCEELVNPQGHGGLFVVGSYVPKTTRQVETLLRAGGIVGIEVDVKQLLDNERRSGEVNRVVKEINACLKNDKDVVVYTSRNLVSTDDDELNIQIGKRVSNSLIEMVKKLEVPPRYLVAKGGITSSDVATKGLGVKRALVMGQVLPGVPVWKLGEESRYPGMSYIVFPGNVGNDNSLLQIRVMLSGKEKPA